MKNISSYCLIGMLMLLVQGLFPHRLAAQDPLLDSMTFSKQYLVQISGKVMNENFVGSLALLTLMPPSPAGINPLQLIIQGYPKRNSRNSFFWNSEYSEMTAIANEITCDIKRTFVKRVPMFFVFMSPELLKHTGAAYEGEKFAEKTALPTLINARAGRLKIRINSNSISGTIWMKGYDPVENAFVQYNAQLFGQWSHGLTPKQELKK